MSQKVLGILPLFVMQLPEGTHGTSDLSKKIPDQNKYTQGLSFPCDDKVRMT
jgi:hypothetical protein